MKDTIKRAFSRPIQLACYAVIGGSMQHLLPDNADVLQWVAFAFVYIALLAYGLDSYNEGFERGLKFMNALER